MKIVLTGGGTAGHAMVGSTLIPMLQQAGWSTVYIGSKAGAERKLIEAQGLSPYHPIPTGKLRRYFSWRHVTDPFCVLAGVVKAYSILKKEAPHVVFSGGGYVSVPVVLAARALGIPVLVRETDCTVGLANKIGLHFATAASVTFPETANQMGPLPVRHHGMMIRPALLQPTTTPFSFQNKKPILCVMGGSLGAAAINAAVRKDLPLLLAQYNIIHLCGAHNIDARYENLEDYRQLEFLEEMAAAYQVADFVLMRCGSNAICEGLALGKRMICVPLTKSGSRGEQAENAQFAAAHGQAVLVQEAALCGQSICDATATLETLPANSRMRLTPEQLMENCSKQIAQLHGLGRDKLRDDFIKNIHDGKKIDFFSLNNAELFVYNELAETFGL